MNKQKLWSVALVIFSALAVLISTTPNSVTVFWPEEGVARAYSFFEQIPGVSAGICILLAGVCSCLGLMLSVADLFCHKEGVRTGMMVLALASTTLAVLPLVADRSVVVLPDMMHPLLMGTVFVGTYLLRKLKK